MTDERAALAAFATEVETLIVAFGRHSDPRDRRLLAEAIAARALALPPDPVALLTAVEAAWTAHVAAMQMEYETGVEMFDKAAIPVALRDAIIAAWEAETPPPRFRLPPDPTRTDEEDNLHD